MDRKAVRRRSSKKAASVPASPQTTTPEVPLQLPTSETDLTPQQILRLQQTIGNRAVQRLLAGNQTAHEHSHPQSIGSHLVRRSVQRSSLTGGVSVFTPLPNDVVEKNDLLSAKLGWAKYKDQIVEHLIRLGYLPPNESPEPIKFAQAIKEFQEDRDGSGDGKIGPGTWKTLRGDMGIPTTPEEALWEATPTWEKTAQSVNKMGRIQGADTLYSSPDDVAANGLGSLKYNTSVFVSLKGGKGNEGWYQITTEDGREGWYNADYVALDPPEPTAELYKIKAGDTPIDLVAEWYKPPNGFKSWWESGSGAGDARFYVAALAFANKGRAGMPSPDSLKDRASWKEVKLVADQSIWKPSKEFLDTFKDKVSSGSITKELWEDAKGLAKKVWGWVVYAASFIAGLLYGPIAWLIDFVVGLVDLVKIIVKVVKSLITGNIIEDAKELWKQITSISMNDIKAVGEDFLSKWTAKDPWDRGFFQGKIIGYVITEIVITVVTVGTVTAAKWAGKLGTVARFIASKLGKFGKRVEQAADALPGKTKKTIKNLTEAGEESGDAAKGAAKTGDEVGDVAGDAGKKSGTTTDPAPEPTKKSTTDTADGGKDGDVPGKPVTYSFREPTASRHSAKSIRAKSMTKANNTVASDWNMVKDDIAAINKGQAKRTGNRFEINGRIYETDGKAGHIYPVEGPGLHQLSRPQFQILGKINTDGEAAAQLFAKHVPGLTQQQIDDVFAIWRAAK